MSRVGGTYGEGKGRDEHPPCEWFFVSLLSHACIGQHHPSLSRYDDEADWKEVRGLTFLLGVDTNGGGVNSIGRRLQRHFAVLTFPRLVQPQLEVFYSSLVTAQPVKGSALRGGSRIERLDQLSDIAPQLVNASVDIHCRMISLFTAAIDRSHYSFSKSDLDVLFDNLRTCDAFTQRSSRAVQLWTIECHSVYGMRLTAPTDTDRFWEALRKSAHAHFGPALSKDIEDGCIPMYVLHVCLYTYVALFL